MTREGVQLRHRGGMARDEPEPPLPLVESEADFEEADPEGRRSVHYHFPVEIEVRAAPEARDPGEVVLQALDRLGQRLENLG